MIISPCPVTRIKLIFLPKKRRPDKASNKYQRISAHLVRRSPWPFLTAVSLGALLTSLVSYFQYNSWSLFYLVVCFFCLSFSVFFWIHDVIIESKVGCHTKLVQKGLRFGMFLFIISEVMFFVSFFWAFFHFSLSPSVFLFCVWPPIGITTIDPWGIPFLNTIILLSSGVTLTTSHRAILANKKTLAKFFLLLTLFYGFFFTLLQLYEYISCPFNINDSVYGSIFFLSTGFHGLHVIIGTVFLLFCYLLMQKRYYTIKRHLSFECGAYYWHFVDVVWLFLFITVYWWGS